MKPFALATPFARCAVWLGVVMCKAVEAMFPLAHFFVSLLDFHATKNRAPTQWMFAVAYATLKGLNLFVTMFALVFLTAAFGFRTHIGSEEDKGIVE